MTAHALVEHFFRHEYGKLVATLSRRFGAEHLDLIEDVAQSTLTRALERWRAQGPPAEPSAWLFRAAHNALIDALRQHTNRARLLRDHHGPGAASAPDASLSGEIHDDLLRMLFVCCDDALPALSRHILALKILCGFDVAEIARSLFLTQANVYKRLSRARARLRHADLCALSPQDFVARLPSVHEILYAMFTEGHLSSHEDHALRRELCAEAVRLALLLSEHPATSTPTTHALLAMFHLHLARWPARRDPDGALLLLEEQDRGSWDPAAIATGLAWLARSAHGTRYSRYHAEASIAAEHCLAPSLEATQWDRICEEYERLGRMSNNPIHRLGHAVALAQWRGAPQGLALLEGLDPPSWLNASYLWYAVCADLHGRCGHQERAERYRTIALENAHQEEVRVLLKRRWRRPRTSLE